MCAAAPPVHGPGGPAWELLRRQGRALVRSAGQFDPTQWDHRTGVRATVCTVVPLLVFLEAGQPIIAVFAALGALNLAVADPPGPVRTSLPVLGVTAVAAPGILALGTILQPLGWAAVPWVAVVVSGLLLLSLWPRFDNVTVTFAVVFVIGVGLTGGGLANVPLHAAAFLLGTLIGLAGVGLQRTLLPPAGPVQAAMARPVSVNVEHAIAVGGTVALGMAVGLALGLPRDFWIMLTIIVALRIRVHDTLAYAWMRVLGTVAGAAIAAAITIGLASAPIEVALLIVSCIAMFALRGVNYTLFAVALTVLVILLLNLLVPGSTLLAEVRVLDTILGGILAAAAGTLLYLLHYQWLRQADPVSPVASPGAALMPPR